MKDSKSLWKLIGEIKRKKKLEVAVFYEEVPITGTIEIIDIDETLEQIIWKADKKILPTLKETRHIYFKHNGEVYILTVIAYDQKEIATSFPSYALDQKLNRTYVRVKTSDKDPILVMINGYKLYADDISEAGVGIITSEEEKECIQEGKECQFEIKLRNDTVKLKGIVVYRRKAGKGVIRIGIKFTEVKQKDRDKIAKYIMDRQREIAKKISMFKV
ncbi:PilZ domain-containing protein [Persephonella sp.]|uniref:PilZ domain-containing protein n=1 Tax=Persephonella sp. TaxID=2060922 RepID=UPI0025E5D9E0|nr:PilZ domain-containing protein [Persephonella sp.]